MQQKCQNDRVLLNFIHGKDINRILFMHQRTPINDKA